MAATQAVAKQQDADDLRAAYDVAFSDWVSEVQQLQAYSADPAVTAEHIAAAKERAKQAELRYRETRNQLASHLYLCA